jgi:hypothetical protein
MPTALGLTTDSLSSRISDGMEIKRTGSSEEEEKPKRLNTISQRIHAAAIEVETLLWRALCDSPDAAAEYMADDCVIVNPLLHPKGKREQLKKDSEPSLAEALQQADRFTGFWFDGQPGVVEIDLMAVALVYKVRVQWGKKGKEQYADATVASAWRQNAGADWLLVSWLVAPTEES